MTRGKSGPWCDANLSCLRISTPQKPWSPTAELKTCWPPMMDSRSRLRSALGSTPIPSPFDSHGHPLRPGARITLATHVGHSIPLPAITYPWLLSSSSFLLPLCRSPVSPSLRFLLSQVVFFVLFFSLFWEKRESHCVFVFSFVCLVFFSPRIICCVRPLFLPSVCLTFLLFPPSL